MKTVTPALAALINGGVFTTFDLYTITLVGGGVLLLSTADIHIAYGGMLWSPRGPRIQIDGSPSLAHWKIGLDVDQWQLSVMPRSRDDFTGAAFPDKIGSVPWLQAAAGGALDAADVVIQRVYFGGTGDGDLYGLNDVFSVSDIYASAGDRPPTYPIPPAGAVPFGGITIFRGSVAEVDVTSSAAVVTINDARQILTTQMPRNLYQASCRHRLFDNGCMLDAAAYAKSATVAVGSSRGKIIASPPAPGGSGTYQLGRLVVTSGLNAGFSQTIARWDNASTFTLLAPLPFNVAVGDALTFYPGCDKTMGQTGCAGFNNLLNFGGDPYIPTPETTT